MVRKIHDCIAQISTRVEGYRTRNTGASQIEIPCVQRKLRSICDGTVEYQWSKKIACGLGHPCHIQCDCFHLDSADTWGLSQMKNCVESQLQIFFQSSLQFRKIAWVTPGRYAWDGPAMVQKRDESFPARILFPSIVRLKRRQQNSQLASRSRVVARKSLILAVLAVFIPLL
jgi:hypothetical protein